MQLDIWLCMFGYHGIPKLATAQFCLMGGDGSPEVSSVTAYSIAAGKYRAAI